MTDFLNKIVNVTHFVQEEMIQELTKEREEFRRQIAEYKREIERLSRTTTTASSSLAVTSDRQQGSSRGTTVSVGVILLVVGLVVGSFLVVWYNNNCKGRGWTTVVTELMTSTITILSFLKYWLQLYRA